MNIKYIFIPVFFIISFSFCAAVTVSQEYYSGASCIFSSQAKGNSIDVISTAKFSFLDYEFSFSGNLLKKNVSWGGEYCHSFSWGRQIFRMGNLSTSGALSRLKNPALYSSPSALRDTIFVTNGINAFLPAASSGSCDPCLFWDFSPKNSKFPDIQAVAFFPDYKINDFSCALALQKRFTVEKLKKCLLQGGVFVPRLAPKKNDSWFSDRHYFNPGHHPVVYGGGDFLWNWGGFSTETAVHMQPFGNACLRMRENVFIKWNDLYFYQSANWIQRGMVAGDSSMPSSELQLFFNPQYRVKWNWGKGNFGCAYQMQKSFAGEWNYYGRIQSKIELKQQNFGVSAYARLYGKGESTVWDYSFSQSYFLKSKGMVFSQRAFFSRLSGKYNFSLGLDFSPRFGLLDTVSLDFSGVERKTEWKMNPGLEFLLKWNIKDINLRFRGEIKVPYIVEIH